MSNEKITRQLVASVSCTFSLLSNGFHMGWPSPSMIKLLAEDSDTPVTPFQADMIVASILFGYLVGAIVYSPVMESLGRKRTLLATVIAYLPACALLGFGKAYWLICTGRFIAGVTTFVNVSTTSIYVTEVASDATRGRLSVLNNFMTNVGIMVVYSVGPWVDRSTLACLGAAIPVVFGLFFIWMPESPYYSVIREKHEEARRNLVWLRATDDVDEELQKVKKTVATRRDTPGRFRDLLLTPLNRKALLIGVGATLTQAFSGITAILAYSETVFRTSGAKLNSSISSIIVSVVQLVVGLQALFTNDLIGRRPMMLISAFGTVFFLSAEAIYFQLQFTGYDVTSLFWLPVTGIVGYMISYESGLGVLPYTIMAEIFPYDVKTKGVCVSLAVCAMGYTFATQTYQFVSKVYGIQYAFWTFAGLTVCSGIFVYYLLPETSQKSLYSIHNDLRDTKRPNETYPLPVRAKIMDHE